MTQDPYDDYTQAFIKVREQIEIERWKMNVVDVNPQENFFCLIFNSNFLKIN